MTNTKILKVQGKEISFKTFGEEDYSSLTDITPGFPDGKFLVPDGCETATAWNS